MKTRTNYVKISQLLCVTSVLLIVAFPFWKGNDKTKINEWLREKKLAVISCSPYVIALIGHSLYRNDEIRRANDKPAREHESTNRCPPVDRQNGNGCSHQQGSLCETNYSKRKILKIQNC